MMRKDRCGTVWNYTCGTTGNVRCGVVIFHTSVHINQQKTTNLVTLIWYMTWLINMHYIPLHILETRRLRGNQIEVFKILNGYEGIDRMFFSQLRKGEGLEDMDLH